MKNRIQRKNIKRKIYTHARRSHIFSFLTSENPQKKRDYTYKDIHTHIHTLTQEPESLRTQRDS